MQDNKVYVVTDTEAGWDSVQGVFGSFETLKEFFLGRYAYPESRHEYEQIEFCNDLSELDDFISDNTGYVIFEEEIV